MAARTFLYFAALCCVALSAAARGRISPALPSENPSDAAVFTALPTSLTTTTSNLTPSSDSLSATSTTLSAAPDTLLHSATIFGRSTRSMAPNQQLSGAHLEALSAHSVADALRYFSGVQLKDYGGIGGLKTLDVRSMGSQHMGIFYDGLQLGNTQNGQIDLGRFSLDNMEQIDLYNGQKSDMLQSAKDFGASGTAYLRTRRPHFEAADSCHNYHHLSATFRTGSFGLVNPALLWEHRWTENISSSVSGEYTYSTGRYRFRYHKFFPDHTTAYDTTATRQNGDIQALRLEASLFGKSPQKNLEWLAKVYGYASERGIPGAIVNNVWHHAQRQWDRNVFAQGHVKRQVSDRYSFLVAGKFSNDYLRYLNPDTTQLYVDNSFRQQELYISAAHSICPIPDLRQRGMDWNLSVATDYQWNALSADIVDFVHPHRNVLLTSVASNFSFQRFKVMASLLGTHAFDCTDNGHSSRIKYTPAAFVNFTAARGLTLRAFYKRSMRLPTFNDLYYTEIGNAALQPEFTTQYDVGELFIRDFNSWFSHLEIKADVYINHVSNKIIAVPKGTGQYRWMMMNIGKVRVCGIEATSQVVLQPISKLSLIGLLNYTFQRAEDHSDPTDNTPGFGTYGGQIAYIPRHSGSAAATLTYSHFSLNYSFIYVGERYHTSANILANYEQPWYTHDLSLGVDLTQSVIARIFKHSRSSATPRVPLFHKKKGVAMPRASLFRNSRGILTPDRSSLPHVKLLLECNNFLNQQYDVVQNYPMPGRNYRLTLRVLSW